MVKVPVVTVLATALPDMVPMSRAGHHGHLGRPPPQLAKEGGGQIDKELSAPAHPEERPEGDKEEDELTHHIQGNTVYAVLGHEKGGRDSFNAVAPVRKGCGKQMAEKGIKKEHCCDDDQG